MSLIPEQNICKLFNMMFEFNAQDLYFKFWIHLRRLNRCGKPAAEGAQETNEHNMTLLYDNHPHETSTCGFKGPSGGSITGS